MKKPKKKYEEDILRFGPLSFRLDNYEDWKPGYQIHLNDAIPGVIGAHRTYASVESAEKHIRKQLIKLGKQLVKLQTNP